MSTITYLDGSQMTSTALSDSAMAQAMQLATAQMLGIVAFSTSITLTAGSATATPTGMGNLAPGYTLTGPGIAAGTTITAVGASSITLSAPATLSGAQTLTVAQPNAYSLVRVGWQQQGQPAWGITDDVVILRCSTIDSDYSRVRDITGTANADTLTQSDVYTRAWRTDWAFYGPSALDHARAVRSGLIKLDFITNLLAQSNLYVQPDIAEPGRNPEMFQSQWWERSDLAVVLYEQITETTTVGIVQSVQTQVYDAAGELDQITATA